MHRIGGGAPALDLSLVVDAGLMPKGRIALQHHGGLSNDQPGTGPLGVVLGHQCTGHMPLLRATAGEGRHPNAVGQLKRSHLEWRKQVGHLRKERQARGTLNTHHGRPPIDTMHKPRPVWGLLPRDHGLG